MSTACLAAFVGVLAAQVWDVGPLGTAPLASAAAAAYGVVLWWRARRHCNC